MEFLNRVELVGVVGTIRKQKVSDQMVANFSVVTEQYHKDKSGSAVIEATWFNIVAWQNNNMPDLDKVDRGSHVHVQAVSVFEDTLAKVVNQDPLLRLLPLTYNYSPN